MLRCTVEQRDGSVCNFYTNITDVLLVHVMKHISNLAKVAKPHYQCDLHPKASHYIIGNYREVRCSWTEGGVNNFKYCDKVLEELPI